MKPYGNQGGEKRGMGGQRSGHPDVMQRSVPKTKQVNPTVSAKMPPSKGSWGHSVQTGSTSPKTDAGGGMGNSSEALHRKIFGK